MDMGDVRVFSVAILQPEDEDGPRVLFALCATEKGEPVDGLGSKAANAV